jgi:aspartate/glutamate racemase
MRDNLHTNKLHSFGIQTVVPSKTEQHNIDRAIHNILNNKDIENTKQSLRNIVISLQNRGIQHILLACTDLQLLFPNIPGIIVHDTMDILAHATVREMTRNV